MEAYLKINRKLFDDPIWLKHEFTPGQALIDLHRMAAWKDHMVDGRMWKRGDVHTSVSQLATRWKWSRQRVRSFIQRLEKSSVLVSKTFPKLTILTIVDYAGSESQQPLSNHSVTIQQPTTEEVKKKNTTYSSRQAGVKRTDLNKEIWSYLRQKHDLSDSDTKRACRTVRGNGRQWSAHTLGALLCAFTRNGIQDPINYAKGILNGGTVPDEHVQHASVLIKNAETKIERQNYSLFANQS